MRQSNRIKVCATAGLVAAVSFAVASTVAVGKYADNANANAKVILETSLNSRLVELWTYTSLIENDIELIAGLDNVQRAMTRFSAAFRALGADPAAEAQRLYITENPHSKDARHMLVKARDGSEYSEMHAAYHRLFSNLANLRGYYDVFLVDVEGNIVYTVFKEEDFGTNLVNGPLRDTQLAKIFRDNLKIAPGTSVASDFERYAPSAYTPAAFEGTPIYLEGVVVGVLIVQLRIDPFNEKMKGSGNLGRSTEFYLVNEIRLMTTESRFVNNAVLAQSADTESVRRALAGASGYHVTENYQGKRVLSAYRPFGWKGGNWAAIAEQDVAELDDDVARLSRMLWLIGAAVTIVAAGIGWLLAAKD